MASSGRIDELRKKFEENPRRYFAPLANEYRKVGDLQQAILICQEHLPQQPGHMSGHIVYGQALFEAGRLDESRAIFETALTLDPENLIALRHLGDIARNSGNIEGAKSWYKRVLEADPRNEEIGQIMSAMGESGSPSSGPGSPTPTELPVIAAQPRDVVAPSASAPTAELSVEAIQQMAAARAAQTARPSGARVMPAVPLDSLPTLVPGVSKVPEAAAQPPVPPTSPKPRRSSRSVTPLDWNDVQETPASGIPSQSDQGSGYTGDSTDLLDIPDITLETKPVVSEPMRATSAGSGDLNLDVDAVFQADPLAIASRPAAPPDAQPLEGLETTSMASPGKESAVGDLPLLDISLEVPPSASPLTPPPPPAEQPAAVDAPLEFIDVGESEPTQAASQPTAPFVTTTMAELYVQQGHLEAAVEIYQQLAAQKPADAEIYARLQALRQAMEGSGAPEAGSDTVAPMLISEPTVAVSQPEPVETESGLDVELEQASSRAHAGAGPSIREFLVAIVAGTADQLFLSNGAAHSATIGGGSIEALFESLPISDSDAAAAEMLSNAYDDTIEVPLLFDPGAETRADASSAESPASDAGAQRFSLDQFFSSEAGGVAGRRSNA